MKLWLLFFGCVPLLANFSAPPAVDLQSMDCWTNCASCKDSCDSDQCEDSCEGLNRVCCGMMGRRPYLSGCGCHEK
jgi:hypothetical protein